MAFKFRTEPFKHQREIFELSKDLESYAFFLEQGTGKSKLTIDTASYLHQKGEINAMFIIAPNGVHRNWVSEEIPKHLDEELLANTEMYIFQTRKAKTKTAQRELKAFWSHKGFKILAMSYDAMMTELGKAVTWTILRDHKCLYVADESARIKTPGAKRTKRAVASSPYAAYRRILTGTPVANSPFDVYSQLKFLDPGFWKSHGISTFLGFKTTFGIWEKKTAYNREYDDLVGFQRLEYLKEIVDSVSTRVTKDEVLDLPERLYSKRFFDMEPKQVRLYDEIVNEFMTYLDNELVTAALAIVRLLRLQQITCGYLPADGEEVVLQDICEKNPRLNLLNEICEDLDHKAIIWCRFKRDIDLVMATLGPEAVRYDGSCDDDMRAQAIEDFQRGEANYFVSNAQTAGEGLTLTAARTVIYYSNTFKLTERLQSEARAHRIGQVHPVNYIDLVAYNTVDNHIIRALSSKLDVASRITGDELRTWL